MAKLGKRELILQLEHAMTSVPEALAGHGVTLAHEGTELVYSFDATAHAPIAGFLHELGKHGIGFKDLRTRESSLEDIFVDLVRAKS
jgi:ABC-2 type transport system ATP-binding protein